MRRESIPYISSVPDGVYPFSQGFRRNAYNVFVNGGGCVRYQPIDWVPPTAPYPEEARCWWIENEHWSCF